MDIFGFLTWIYRVIYLYVVGCCFWSVFTHKKFQRQIGFALIAVPFLLRLLCIK